MAFDAKAYCEAVSPPVYIDRAGVAHTGRILSVFEMGRLEPFLAVPEGETEEQGRQRCRSLFTALFPDAPAEMIQEILDLPAEAFTLALQDFFAHQRRRPSVDAPA